MCVWDSDGMFNKYLPPMCQRYQAHVIEIVVNTHVHPWLIHVDA